MVIKGQSNLQKPFRFNYHSVVQRPILTTAREPGADKEGPRLLSLFKDWLLFALAICSLTLHHSKCQFDLSFRSCFNSNNRLLCCVFKNNYFHLLLVRILSYRVRVNICFMLNYYSQQFWVAMNMDFNQSKTIKRFPQFFHNSAAIIVISNVLNN